MGKKRFKLVIFARSPVLGRVKRRIASSLGDAAAHAVYRKLFRQCVRTALDAKRLDPTIDLVLNHLGPRPEKDLPVPFDGTTLAQSPKGMSENLASAVRSPARGKYRGTMVIGADHPTLLPEHLLEMADLLSRHPVAIGPTEDGGFWSLATTVPLYEAVKGLPLGTGAALQGLLDALAELGIPYGFGQTLWDVDTPEDVLRWKNLLARKNP